MRDHFKYHRTCPCPTNPSSVKIFFAIRMPIQRIAAALGDLSGQTVVEIGPGRGRHHRGTRRARCARHRDRARSRTRPAPSYPNFRPSASPYSSRMSFSSISRRPRKPAAIACRSSATCPTTSLRPFCLNSPPATPRSIAPSSWCSARSPTASSPHPARATMACSPSPCRCTARSRRLFTLPPGRLFSPSRRTLHRLSLAICSALRRAGSRRGVRSFDLPARPSRKSGKPSPTTCAPPGSIQPPHMPPLRQRGSAPGARRRALHPFARPHSIFISKRKRPPRQAKRPLCPKHRQIIWDGSEQAAVEKNDSPRRGRTAPTAPAIRRARRGRGRPRVCADMPEAASWDAQPASWQQGAPGHRRPHPAYRLRPMARCNRPRRLRAQRRRNRPPNRHRRCPVAWRQRHPIHWKPSIDRHNGRRTHSMRAIDWVRIERFRRSRPHRQLVPLWRGPYREIPTRAAAHSISASAPPRVAPSRGPAPAKGVVVVPGAALVRHIAPRLA